MIVDCAMTSLGVEKHAVAVRILDQALANPHLADILTLELGSVHVEMASEPFDLSTVHPDIAGIARAAVPTAGAPESQAVLIPQCVGHNYPPI
jgi:hypothetical protein